jgi:hypothetical protein
MDDSLILSELEAQVRTMPNFPATGADRLTFFMMEAHYEWVGRTIALLTAWDKTKAIPARVAAQNLETAIFMQNVGTIRITLHEAISDLKLRVQHRPGGAFAANTPYDFFREFKNLLTQATKELFIIDAYLSDGIFTYLSAAVSGVPIRLMTKSERKPKLIPLVRAGQQAFQQQYQRQVETRETTQIHDRVIFLDGQTCYVSGASFKDAAKNAPTYLTFLSPDLIPDKLAAYEAIWNQATPI